LISLSGLSVDEFFAVGKAWKEVELMNGDFLLQSQEPGWTREKNLETCEMLGTADTEGGVLSIPKDKFIQFYSRTLEKLMEDDFSLGSALSLLAIDSRQYYEADRLLGDAGELPSKRRDYMVALAKSIIPLSPADRDVARPTAAQ